MAGGGLGGLAAAIALRASGHDPVVFERSVEFRPVGAGISLWPNGVKALALLGLHEGLEALGGRLERMGYSDALGEVLTEFDLTPLYREVGERAWPISRADLQDLLVGALGGERIRFGTSVVGVACREDKVIVSCEGADDLECDLVVAADGTHSAIRDWVVGKPVARQYVGYVNYNTVVSGADLPVAEGTWMTFVGAGKRASVMPCGPGRSYVFFDIPMAEDVAGSGGGRVIDELYLAFGHWGPPVRRLLDVAAEAVVNRVAIHEVPSLPRWRRERVVLLGDSAHAMAPDLGQGGCQALEDAIVLVRHLAASGDSVPEALERYEAERRARTAEISRRARKRSDITHAVEPAITEAWYRSLRHEDGEGVIAGLVESVVTGPCR